jgi:hypothetical protein
LIERGEGTAWIFLSLHISETASYKKKKKLSEPPKIQIAPVKEATRFNSKHSGEYNGNRVVMRFQSIFQSEKNNPANKQKL